MDIVMPMERIILGLAIRKKMNMEDKGQFIDNKALVELCCYA